MSNKPDGTVTFLLTDIEGSTKLAQQFPEALHTALLRHHEILQQSIESNNGHVFEIVGDAFYSAFSNAHHAVKAACEIQRQLVSEPWGEVSIKIRIGLNTGKAEWNGTRYSGYMTISRSQRVMSVAHGGQILISKDVYNNVKGITPAEFTFRDLGERRLKSLLKPEHLYQVITTGLQAEFPPLNTLDARPNNLPLQITSFIGRKKEMAEIKKILSNSRLLTLSGAGGTGKTRLSLQAGEEMIDDFANGVWFTELASLSDPALVVQEIASVFGLSESGSGKIIDVLISHLKDKELLLILDNCEHLIHECAQTANILIRKCAKLKILVSSREALKITGETEYRVPSLSVPDLKENYSAETLIQHEAVQLFTERSASVKPGFNVTDTNAGYVAQICSRLEGIPFAIELAAARMRTLPVEKICERLSDRFNLLTGGSRAALPRQQTLHAMIDWSYELLNEQEKALLRRLSVFSGGWKIESAEEICSGNGIESNDVLDLLSSLLDKSLVVPDDRNERYNLLEMVKEYGRVKLKDRSEETAQNQKHLEYFLKMAEDASIYMEGFSQSLWLDKLEEEHDNLRKALGFSVSKEFDTDTAIRLNSSLKWLWEIRGYFSEGREWSERMLENHNLDTKTKIRTYNYMGRLAIYQSDYNDAEIILNKATELYTGIDDKVILSRLLFSKGDLASRMQKFDESTKLCYDSLELSKSLNDYIGIANCYMLLGNLSSDQKDFVAAKKHYNDALKLYRDNNNPSSYRLIYSLARNAVLEKDYEVAGRMFDEVLKYWREVGNKQGVAYTLFNLAKMSRLQSQNDESFNRYQDALKLMVEISDRTGIMASIRDIGYVYQTKGYLENAVKLIEAAESLSIKNGVHLITSEHVHNQAMQNIRDSLGKEEYYRASNEGRNLTMEQAIELAMKKLE